MIGDSEVSLCVPSHVVPAGAVAALLDGGGGVAHQVDVELLAVGGLHARLGEVEVGATPRHPLPAGLAPAIPLLQTWGGLRGCFEQGWLPLLHSQNPHSQWAWGGQPPKHWLLE